MEEFEFEFRAEYSRKGWWMVVQKWTFLDLDLVVYPPGDFVFLECFVCHSRL